MTARRIELLVLDAHGVVLNDPFACFLQRLAAATGRPLVEVRRHWQEEIRTPAWLGEIDEAELWRRLTGQHDGGNWRRTLEEAYRPGPAAPHLARWSQYAPLWLLSNHTSPALQQRLDRLGLTAFFERILVSDALGAAKPDPAAFVPILQRVADPACALVVDDQTKNVAAAAHLGFDTVHASSGSDWLANVEERLARTPRRAVLRLSV